MSLTLREQIEEQIECISVLYDLKYSSRVWLAAFGLFCAKIGFEAARELQDFDMVKDVYYEYPTFADLEREITGESNEK